MKPLWFVLCALAPGWALASNSTLPSATLFVAPEGNDAWSGKLESPNLARTDGPLATLTGARDAVRVLKRHGQAALTVRVAGGRYIMTGPLELTPEDSGSAQAPIAYEATLGAQPVFSGGRPITGWSLGKNGMWHTRIPEVANGTWYFEQLWVNGRRAVRARSPNKFWFQIVGVQETPLGPVQDGRASRARQTVMLEDLGGLSGLEPAELRDVHLLVYHNWDTTRRFVESVDAGKGAILTTGRGMLPWNRWQEGSTCVLENYRSALDAPGEWFLGRDGTLSYLPLPGEDMSAAEVIAPRANRFIRLKGDLASGRFVEHITFRGLTFHHAQWLTPPEGIEPDQAASSIEAVVQADGARHITLEDCEFGHFGGYGIWFRKGCREVSMRRCHVFDMGAGGVRIGETRLAQDGSELTSHVMLDNSIIRHGGRIFPCAVGVWVGQSGENLITHNEIADLFYSGVSLGWCWGYGESAARHNVVAFNHIHHLGWGWLSDLGGVYTLGPSEGTVVTNNVVHDIYAHGYGGWGLYTDEGSSGILFQNNLVHATKTGSFHQHYGRENVVRNNVFANSQAHQLQVTRVEPHRSFTFERNLVYWTNESDLVAGPWDKLNYQACSNCYWNPRVTPELAAKALAVLQARTNEVGTVITDPLFVKPEANDFRLQSNSPALRLGFQPWDHSRVGVYGHSAWKAKAEGENYPELELPPNSP